MICGLSCDFAGRGSERLLDRGPRCRPWLTPASGTVVARGPSHELTLRRLKVTTSDRSSLGG